MTITTPTNTVELMKNLITAVRKQLILDEDFYTEENVKKLTGGAIFELTARETKQIAEVIDFRTITDRQENGSDGWSIRFSLETTPNAKKIAALWANVIVDQPELDYSTIEQLVAHTWQEVPQPWSSNRIYREPTSMYGNAEREYIDITSNLKETAHFSFNPAGSFSSLAFFLEEQ